MAGRNDDAVWITGIGVATSLGNTTTNSPRI